MKTTSYRSSGMTLIELMIALAVIGVIMAISIPAYNSYIESSVKAVMRNNMENLRLFEEQYKLENRTYINGVFDPDNPGAAGGLKALLGWDPDSDIRIKYEVTAASGTAFTVTATELDKGYTLTQSYPY